MGRDQKLLDLARAVDGSPIRDSYKGTRFRTVKVIVPSHSRIGRAVLIGCITAVLGCAVWLMGSKAYRDAASARASDAYAAILYGGAKKERPIIHKTVMTVTNVISQPAIPVKVRTSIPSIDGTNTVPAFTVQLPPKPQ